MTVGHPQNGTRSEISSTTPSNVKVVVRIRPVNTVEKQAPQNIVVRDMNEHVLAFDPKDESCSPMRVHKTPRDIRKRRNKDMKFAFDYVFGPDSTNTEVYEHTTKAILDGLLEGYNCSVFAYGATGAGKTYTMLGSDQQPGVMFHTMIDLYERISNMKDEKTCDVAVSYLEIYNEQIRDLILPRGSLPIREDPKTGVIVPGLSLHKPKTAEELLYMLQFGNKNRSQHPTDANAESSRSHAVFQVFVRLRDRTANISAEVSVAKLCLVDLAGSERATMTKNHGARFREGANINRSLLALGNVINSLAENKHKGHVPYRDSKLTRLLKDSLGGNCRTVMIAAVSPSGLSYDDTYNTLKYADRAKNIRSSLKKNILNVDFHVSRYGQIVEDLRKEIGELKSKLQMYEEGKIATSRRKSSGEEQRLRAVLANIFKCRLEVRREQLGLECAYRDVQWKLGWKQRGLLRLRLLSSTGQAETCERMERSLKSLQTRLDVLAKQKEALSAKLADNQDWLTRIRAEMLLASGDNTVPEQLDECVRMHHLEVDVSEARQHTKHLQKLVKSQHKEANISDRMLTSLLHLVRKQHFILKGHNLATSDLVEEYDAVSSLVNGRDVTWEDETRDESPVPIADIINLPLLNSVTINGDGHRGIPTQSCVGVATSHNGDHAPRQNGPNSESRPDSELTSQLCLAGHTPSFKKFASLHSSKSAPSLEQTAECDQPPASALDLEDNHLNSESQGYSHLNDTISRLAPNTGHKKSGTVLDSTFTLQVGGSNDGQLSGSVSCNTPNSGLAIPMMTKSYKPKIEFEYLCQSPFSRSAVVRQTVECLDENSPYRHATCLPMTQKPLPAQVVSPIPIPRSVQTYLCSQSSTEHSSDIPKLNLAQYVLSDNVPQNTNLQGKNLVNICGSSTVTKSHPIENSHRSNPVPNPSLQGSATVTKCRPTCLQEPNTNGKENSQDGFCFEKKKSGVARAITFGDVSNTGDSRQDYMTYADILKTPSPVRVPLKPLENNTPVSVPCQQLNSANDTDKQIYRLNGKGEENARLLRRYGLPSMASSSAQMSGNCKPSYMRLTKSSSQRSQLFTRVPLKDDQTASRKLTTGQSVNPVSRSLSRVRSKSASNLNGKSRWQH